jgi:hypothetical protein
VREHRVVGYYARARLVRDFYLDLWERALLLVVLVVQARIPGGASPSLGFFNGMIARSERDAPELEHRYLRHRPRTQSVLVRPHVGQGDNGGVVRC